MAHTRTFGAHQPFPLSRQSSPPQQIWMGFGTFVVVVAAAAASVVVAVAKFPLPPSLSSSRAMNEFFISTVACSSRVVRRPGGTAVEQAACAF